MIWEHWFRNSLNGRDIIIDDFSKLTADYYNFLIAYKGKFTAANCDDAFDIISDKEIKLIRNCHKSAKLDIPIYMNQVIMIILYIKHMT